MAENITATEVIPARPERVFSAWLDAAEHGKMTNSHATDEGDGRFTAWDGYISGRTVSSEPHNLIVQTWRTTEFPEGAPDSHLTLRFEPQGEATKLTIAQDNLPDGQADAYLAGWKDYYFNPMKTYFGAPGRAEQLREVGEKIGGALDEVTHQMEEVAREAAELVEQASASARVQAKKTVKAVKKVQKQAAAKIKAVSKKVKALVSKKKTVAKAKSKPKAKPKAKVVAKPAKKKVAKAKSSPKKAAAKKSKKR